MKKQIITIVFLAFVFSAGAQDQPKPKVTTSSRPAAVDVEKEQLKKAALAPNPTDFESEELYLKAKADWIRANPKLYQKLTAVKEEEAKPK